MRTVGTSFTRNAPEYFARCVQGERYGHLVLAGAQQAFDLLARVLVTGGRTTVAVEDPGYPPLRATFLAAGAKVSAVGVDAEGLVVHQLPPQARVICVTPSHQFPLGGVMSARRRSELLDFAQTRRAVIVEDDYDGEFRFGDRPLDALQTLDRAASVFYVGTFSKSLLPGVRLAWLPKRASSGSEFTPWAFTTHAVRSSAACCSVMAR